MKVIRKINNNSAICLDSAGNEVVAIGTGLGFPPVPYELTDLSKIQRTYYNINPMYLSLLNEIPEEMFSISTKIVELYKMKVNPTVSANIVFTLADHINFALERVRKNIHLETPFQHEMQHLYEAEYEIGQQALTIINEAFDVRMPKTEAGNIALHLINAETITPSAIRVNNLERILLEIIDIIGKHFQIYIDKESMNYSRFASHLQYLLKRGKKDKQLSSENQRMFLDVRKQYPNTYQAVLKITEYIEKELNFELNEEEQLYLILHVNRLCAREDCYQ